MKSIYKYLIAFFAILLPLVAYAASETSNPYDKVTQGKSTVADKDYVFNIGAGAANPRLRGKASTNKLQFAHDGATFKDIGSGSGGGGGGVVLNTNTGFEEGLTAWTASGGTFTLETTAANVGFATQAGAWDASAASQTLSNDAVTVPAGLFGKVCSLSWYYKGGDANLKAQVYDGSNVIAESSVFSAQTTYSAKQVVYFTCPSSGTMQARFIASADAAIVYVDDVKLGQEIALAQVVAGTVAKAYIPATASCTWDRTNTAHGPFGTTAACPGPTAEIQRDGVTVSGTDTDLPRFTVNGLKAGKYTAIVKLSGFNSAASNYIAYAVNDGSTTSGYTVGFGGDNQPFVLVAHFDYVHSGTVSKTFEVYGAAQSATTARIDNTNNPNANGRVELILSRETSESQDAISVDQSGWFIDANIGGANLSLATTDLATYTEIVNAGLDLVAGSGSAAAEIPCSTTNPSSGLTCSAGSEGVGVAFVPPTAGKYEVCMNFTHDMFVATGDGESTFEIVQTPNNAQTILARGGTRATSGNNSNNSDSSKDPHYLCGDFTLSDTSKATFRLMYVNDSISGITTNVLYADRAAGVKGDRDIRVRVRRRVEFADAVKFTNLVTTSVQAGLKINVAQINMATSTSCSIGSQIGSWVSAAAYAGTAGDCTITITSGIYASAPYCFATSTGFLAAPNTTRIPHVQSVSATSLTVRQRNTAAAGDDGNYNLTCIGQ